MAPDGNCLYQALFYYLKKFDLRYIEKEFYYEQGAKDVLHLKRILILYDYI